MTTSESEPLKASKPPQSPQQYYSAKKVASLIGCVEGSIHRYAKNGTISKANYIRVNNKYLFTEEAVNEARAALEAGRRRKPPSAASKSPSSSSSPGTSSGLNGSASPFHMATGGMAVVSLDAVEARLERALEDKVPALVLRALREFYQRYVAAPTPPPVAVIDEPSEPDTEH